MFFIYNVALNLNQFHVLILRCNNDLFNDERKTNRVGLLRDLFKPRLSSSGRCTTHHHNFDYTRFLLHALTLERIPTSPNPSKMRLHCNVKRIYRNKITALIS